MTEVIYRERRRRYHWPEFQLNLWIFTMLAAAATVLGINAWFITVQNTMKVGIPWIFTFNVIVGSLTILFLILILVLASQRLLIPGIILLGSFILFVLWLTALIETSIQLFGAGNVNGNCQQFVQDEKFTGISVETLAWLTQNTICGTWKATFAFEVVGTVWFLWMIVMAWQVNRDEYD